jgi:hypothetical protein
MHETSVELAKLPVVNLYAVISRVIFGLTTTPHPNCLNSTICIGTSDGRHWIGQKRKWRIGLYKIWPQMTLLVPSAIYCQESWRHKWPDVVETSLRNWKLKYVSFAMITILQLSWVNTNNSNYPSQEQICSTVDVWNVIGWWSIRRRHRTALLFWPSSAASWTQRLTLVILRNESDISSL